MTKRRNPFEDTHFLRKMHIGAREVNLGVNHTENMKKVYENTLKMLFDGSSKTQIKINVQSGMPAIQNGIPPIQNGISTVQNGISAVQNGMPAIQNGMPVIQNGMPAIQHGKPANHNGILAVHNGMPVLQNGFSNRNENANGKVNQMNPCCASNQQIICSFCERIRCITCSRICDICCNTFCHLCSILQYDEHEETAVCLTCM